MILAVEMMHKVLLIKISLIVLFAIRGFEGKCLKSNNFGFEQQIDDYKEIGSGMKLMAAPANSVCSGAIKLELADQISFNNSESSSGESINCANVSHTLWYYYVSQFDGTLLVAINNPFSGVLTAAYESETCPTDLTNTLSCPVSDFGITVKKGKKYFFSVSSSNETTGSAGIFIFGIGPSSSTAEVIADDIIYVGTTTNVYILTQLSGSYTVTLKCGQQETSQNNVSFNQITFPVPTGFLGTCTFDLTVVPDYIQTVIPKDVTSLVPVDYTNPADDVDIIQGTSFNIQLYATQILDGVLLTVKQKCGTLEETSYQNISIGTEFNGSMPLNYTGPCVLYTDRTDYYAASTRTFNSTKGDIVISTTNGTSFVAGFPILVSVTSSPTGTFDVNLTCTESGSSNTQGGFSSSVIEYNIGNSFYGQSCSLTVVNYDTSLYNPPNVVYVKVVQPVSFAYPRGGQTYSVFYGNYPKFKLFAPVSIKNNTVEVTQNCGNGGTFTYSNIIVNQEYTADQTPAKFVGSCIFSSAASGFYSNSNPIVLVHFEAVALTIVQPIENQSFSAGKHEIISIYAGPNGIFSGIFLPDAIQPQSYQVSNIPSGVDFKILIPDYLYGPYKFTLFNYPQMYPTPDSVDVVVTQQLYILTPQAGSLVNPFVNIDFLVTADSSTLKLPVSLVLNCSDTTVYYLNMDTNTAYSYPNSYGLKGQCTLSCEVADLTYLIPFAPISFKLGVALAFDFVPIQVVNGVSFEISIKSISAAYVPATTDIQISCNGIIQSYTGIDINSLVTLDLNLAVSGTGPYTCSITNVPDVVFNSISATTTLLVPLDQQQKAEVAKNLVIVGGFF